MKAQLADAFASAAGVDARTAAPVGAALAALVAAVGGVVRALGAHHAEHTDAPGEVNCCADVDCSSEDLPTEVEELLIISPCPGTSPGEGLGPPERSDQSVVRASQ